MDKLTKVQRIIRLQDLIEEWNQNSVVNKRQKNYIINCYKREIHKLQIDDKKYYDHYKSSFNNY